MRKSHVPMPTDSANRKFSGDDGTSRFALPARMCAMCNCALHRHTSRMPENSNTNGFICISFSLLHNFRIRNFHFFPRPTTTACSWSNYYYFSIVSKMHEKIVRYRGSSIDRQTVDGDDHCGADNNINVNTFVCSLYFDGENINWKRHTVQLPPNRLDTIFSKYNESLRETFMYAYCVCVGNTRNGMANRDQRMSKLSALAEAMRMHP